MIDPHPGPHLVDLSTLLLCSDLHTYLCTIPAVADLPAGHQVPPSWAGLTGVVFEFAPHGLRPLSVFIPVSAFPPGTGAEFHELLDKLHDPAALAELAAASDAAHDANRAAGLLPGSSPVRCPGCGSRLFGAVAVRGACLACYPDLPPGDAAEVAP